MPAIVQTLWSLFGTDSFHQSCRKRFPGEKLVTFRVLGIGEVVSVFDPQLIREVFSGDRDALRAGEANAQLLGMVGPNSVLVLDGERHLRKRRLLLPPFHGEAIRQHVQVVEEITAAEVERWPLGEQFALWPRMRTITMEVILRAVIGVREESRRRRLRELLPSFIGGGVFGMLAETRLSALTQGAAGRRLPWVRARAQAEEVLYEEIADHRASPEDRDDVLALLIAARDEDGRALGDEELCDHVITLLVAGHETTAAALAWCFERVLRHPEVLARCGEAGPENDDYLTAVVNETLRVRPIINAALRKLSAPLELGGYRLPAGTTVAASIAGVQRSPEIYTEPLRFWPARFLDGGQPAPYTLIPFGGGPRRCIGASFAVMEMKTVLRTVVQHVKLQASDLRDERPSRTRSVGTVPARGARAIATARM